MSTKTTAVKAEEFIRWLESLTLTQRRSKAVRKVLTTAGRIASSLRTPDQIKAGPGRPRKVKHDPNAKRCWCADCRAKFPSYECAPNE